MPKISVIVPVYNTLKYLPKCLDSLLRQTLKEIEIICINDASTDDSLTLLKQYAEKDTRIRIIDFADHQGVSIARNSGIKSAYGEYIAFVDSDDFLDLDFYEKLYAKAVKTGADIVKGDLKEYSSDGTTKTHPVNQNILQYKNKLCFHFTFTTAIYRLSLIKNKHCFYESRLFYAEDLVWLNRIVIAANTVEIVPDVFYNYQRRNDSTDTQVLSEKNAKSAYIAWKHIFLNTVNYAKSSDLDFSCCYKNYWLGAQGFIFRTTTPETKSRFCKLLFFFYHHCPDFYTRYLTVNNNFAFLLYLEQNNLEKFMKFMQNKHSFADFIFANLRYRIKQKTRSKISVVVPVYNAQDYLKKCLDSLCRQTYPNMEIICVDDCSTDKSLQILNDYAENDKRIRIVRRSENGGQAEARQSGIDIASGDYIGFADSDDWVDYDYYEKMLDRAKRDQTDIVINATITCHVGDKESPHIFPGHKSLQRMIYDEPSKLTNKFFCVVWNKLFKAAFLKHRKYIIPERNPHEDVYFHYATFAFAESVSFFDGPAYHYLNRETSISHTKHDWGVEHIKAYSRIYDFYRDNGLLDKKIKLYSTMPFFNIKNEKAFDEYKSYFIKIHDYLNQNKEIFNALDLFFAQAVIYCKNYAEYASKYPAGALMSFLRGKK